MPCLAVSQEEILVLYHGTSSVFLERIFKQGLLPRKYTGISNWDVPESWIDMSSNPELVYLASTPEKARNIGYRAVEVYGGTPVVLEARVSSHYLFPDEDSGFAVVLRKNWRKSLEIRGTCAYRGIIPPSDIKIYKRTIAT